jgi:hypothetical protein
MREYEQLVARVKPAVDIMEEFGVGDQPRCAWGLLDPGLQMASNILSAYRFMHELSIMLTAERRK